MDTTAEGVDVRGFVTEAISSTYRRAAALVFPCLRGLRPACARSNGVVARSRARTPHRCRRSPATPPACSTRTIHARSRRVHTRHAGEWSCASNVHASSPGRDRTRPRRRLPRASLTHAAGARRANLSAQRAEMRGALREMRRHDDGAPDRAAPGGGLVRSATTIVLRAE